MKTLTFTLKSIVILVFLLRSSESFSQNVGINSTGNRPDTSAMLDISSADKGLLIPRVNLTSLTDVSTITLPAASLLVYNTNNSLTGGSGFYYNNGTSTSPNWIKLTTAGAGNGSTWGLTGNSGTNTSANFIGTTDSTQLVIKTSNAERIRISETGNVGIGTTVPAALLHLKDGHLRSEQTNPPTVSVTTQNGISAAAIAANSSDIKGTITTTGTNTITNNTAITITFNTTYTVAPTVLITAANVNTQSCTYSVSSTSTSFTLNFKLGGSNPSFNYIVIE